MYLKLLQFLTTLTIALVAYSFFTDGLLRSRRTLSEKNEMTIDNLASNEREEKILKDVFGKDLKPLSNDVKLIVVLVDALREDFVEGKFVNNDFEASPTKFTFFNEKLKEEPWNSKFYTLIADTPTLTSQRIKGSSTGTIPTYFDMGESMGDSNHVDEDSFVYQVKQAGKSIGFLGDNFWVSLFGQLFDNTWYSQSLDVVDLDTNDEGIVENMQQFVTTYDVNIMHFLGVDHAAHCYGVPHQELDRKIQDVDAALHKLASYMEENTTLLVYGDHGTSSGGYHGGSSEPERNTILFTYSKGNRYSDKYDFTQFAPKQNQTNLAATISYLAKSNSPFSNVGLLIPELLTYPPSVSHQDQLKDKMLRLFLNLQQVRLLIFKYSRVAYFFDDDEVKDLEPSIQKLKLQFFDYLENGITELKYQEFYDDVSSLIYESTIQIRSNPLDKLKVWTGFLLLLLSTLGAFVSQTFYHNKANDQYQQVNTEDKK